MLTIIILIGLLIVWKIDFVATLLNVRAFPAQVPGPLADVMDEPKREQAQAYLHANAGFHILQSTVNLGVLLVFWWIGGFAWLDTLCRSLASNEIVIGLLFLSAIFLATSLVALPFRIYDTFVIEQRFGFNRSTPKTFVGDTLKGLLLSAILGLPLAAGVLWIFATIPNAWLWAWILITVFQLIVMYLAPSLILPLFNKFTPMEDTDLRRSIEALGERCGFPLEGVFVMDGSKRSSKANAFFTGFGKRKKIALYDTLIEKSSHDELLGVLAHEIGHFRRGHIRQRLVVGIIQMGVLLFLLGKAIEPNGWFSGLLFEAFKVETISPHVGLVLFSILLDPVSRGLGVMANAWSRKHEFEADAFAAEITGDSAALGRALRKLTADHLSHPDPSRLRVWLDYSHPPLLQRLRALERVPGGQAAP